MRYQHNRLQQLRGFYYAARMKSMSRAAEQMSLSQPTVSLQIQALERQLQTKLFERRGPRIRLTRDGETLLEMVRPLVEGVERLDEDFVSRRGSVATGTVNVAAGGSTLQYILPSIIGAYVHEYPLVDLRLHNVTGKRGLELLRAGEVDLAIGPLFDVPSDVVFHPLVTYEPMLIAARVHPLAQRKRISLKLVAQYPLILPPREQSTYRIVEMVFAEHSLQHEVKLEIGGYDVIKTYVKLGLGISIVMSHCLGKKEDLYTAPLKRWFPQRDYGLVLLKGRAPSPVAQRFMDVVSRNVKRLAP
jgi:DNA-binding transcriptional LysR family regulator